MGTLSKGQRKRALLAIGLLTPQPILLADEPFDGLDLRQSRDVAQTLRDHAATGRTLVLSIHQITDAARVCDRFVLLSGGRICGEGTLDELSDLARGRLGADAGPEPSDRVDRDDRDLEEVFLALT
jgi:ABC-2 type transport system ATP-binding protein